MRVRNPIEDLEALIAYLSMSDEDKAVDFVYDQTWVVKNETTAVEDAIEDADTSQEVVEELQEFADDEDIFSGDLSEEAIRAIAKHLDIDRATEHLAAYEPGDVPTWNVATLDKQDIQNGWLVHASDHASSIERKGFTRGVSDLTKLGLTTHLPEFYKEDVGYDFAFTPNDFSHYGFYAGRPKYGNGLVIFKAPYVLIWHYGDGEPQAIFWGPDATDIHQVFEGDELRYAIETYDGDGIEADTIEELIAELER